MNLLNPLGWQMQSYELRGRLGLKAGHHLPKEGLPPQDVDGMTVYVAPMTDPRHRRHRVLVICQCGEHVPAGRLHQHLKGVGHENR